MTLSQIQYFLTAARCLNFTTAARELYISQPALGRQISAMEDELGVLLFVRSKNTLQLTPVGSMLRDEFTGLMKSYNGILQKVHAMGSDSSILVRIGVLEGYGLGDILPTFLNTCRREYPDLMLDIIPLSYRELNKELVDGNLDVIVTFRHDVMGRPDMALRALCSIPTYVVYHQDVVELNQEDANPYDICRQLFIFNSPEDSDASFSAEMAACDKMGITPRYKMVDRVNTQLFYIRQAYGCGILAGNSVLRTDPAIIFESRPELPPYELVAAWGVRSTNPGIHLCMDLLQQLIRESDEIKYW